MTAPTSATQALKDWLESGTTGLSSLAMARRLAPLAGIDVFIPRERGFWNDSHPSDPSDLGRCLGLLGAVPSLAAFLPGMAGVSPQWAALVASWGELEALYREELPAGPAPRCYRRMREILEAVNELGRAARIRDEREAADREARLLAESGSLYRAVLKVVEGCDEGTIMKVIDGDEIREMRTLIARVEGKGVAR
jgi:hypothetical protein